MPVAVLASALHCNSSKQLQHTPLQELRILEMLPFDRRVVQFFGSCTQDGKILLVLEFMQVTFSCCKQLNFFWPKFAFAVKWIAIKCTHLLHVLMLHALW